jgi:hypothetical protein
MAGYSNQNLRPQSPKKNGECDESSNDSEYLQWIIGLVEDHAFGCNIGREHFYCASAGPIVNLRGSASG